MIHSVFFNKIIKNIGWIKKLKFPIGKKVYFIGTPEYSNIGDSAIALAQMMFLEKCGFKKNHIKEYTQREYKNDVAYYKRYIGKHHLICGIGGGNMGNLWYNEELFRYSFIDEFPKNPIIIFPQTVFFTNNEDGEKKKKDSISHYNDHDNLTLVARDKQSFKMMNCLYKQSKVMLTPDIVLSTKMEDYGVSIKHRLGVLLVFRNDSEKQMSDTDRQKIQSYLNENSIPYRKTDMYSSIPVTKENRMLLVRNKMQEFADSQIVITDRLHGMVFAALTGTPCIVFSNNHHKVTGTYEWISYLPYIKYVNRVNKVKEVLPAFMKIGQCEFNEKQLQKPFIYLKERIREHVS